MQRLRIILSIGILVPLLLLATSEGCKKAGPIQPPPPSAPDTTSNAIAWQAYTLGDAASQAYDVAIASPSDAWVVGHYEVIGAPTGYNAAHWDGSSWQISGVTFTPCVGTGPGGCDLLPAVLSPSPGEVWFCNGGNFVHQNQSIRERVCVPMDVLPGAIRRMTARNAQDIWAVGELGSALHYDGASWQVTSANTAITLVDAWLSPDGKRLFACGYTSDQSQSALFVHDASGWQQIAHYPPYDSTNEITTSVWGCDNDSLYVLGNVGLYRYSQHAPFGHRPVYVHLPKFTHMVRGTGPNDLFVVGNEGFLAHYNGVSWRSYETNPIDFFQSVAVTPNLVIVVGHRLNDVIRRQMVMYHAVR